MLLNDDRNFVTAAVDWATQNPGILMPNIPAWGGYFGKDPSIEPLNLCDWKDNVKHVHVAPQIIPFMIALNLGRPLKELASIIKHHGITAHHLGEISFKSNEDFHLIHGKSWIQQIDLYLNFFKACDLDPELADRVDTARIHYGYSEAVSLSLLHSSDPKAWLSTRLESGSSSNMEKAEELVYLAATTYKWLDPKFWPNGNFGQLLDRCGAFHDKILLGNPKRHADDLQGFWAQVVYESTFRLTMEETNDLFKQITGLLYSNYSKQTVRALRTLERGDYGGTDFEAITSLTQAAEEHGALHLLPVELMVAAAPGERRIASFGEEYRTWATSGVFKTIDDAPDQFFKKATDQFMAIPVEDLGWFEQRALWKLPRIGMPAQDFSEVDIEALMTRVFQVGQTLRGAEEYRETVRNGQIGLVEYFTDSRALSQQYLDNLSQDDLEIVVRAGAAPEMRGNLSLTGKARTFHDELGI
ncbi:hypothetical protein [Pseudomonas sp. PLMAX]|uniref:hypothetical protein n=1 Tax=Pseudomonas sp. PLMAX TaxID=2201998 RepID=UPI0038B79F42